MKTTRRQLEMLACLTLGALLAACGATAAGSGGAEPAPAADESARAEAAGVVERFDIAKAGWPIMVPVTVAGEEHLFMVDTGSSHTVYDLSLRPHLGEPLRRTEASTAGGDIEVETFQAPDAAIGAINIRTDSPVLAVDLSLPSKIFGARLGGVVGMDVLRGLVAHIDFDAGRLELSRGIEAQPQGEAVPIEYTSDQTLPLVQVEIAAGVPARFLIDSGNNGTLDVPGEAYDQLVEAGLIEGNCSSRSVSAAGRIHVDRFGRISGFGLGSSRHGQLLISEGLPSIGLGVLSRYVVTFDFPRATMYLQRGRRFDLPDWPRMAGLRIWLVDGAVLVHSLEDDGPAVGSGIEPGDRLTAVDGRPLAELGLEGAAQLFRTEPGRVLELTLSRGDETLTRSITLNAACLEGEGAGAPDGEEGTGD